MRSRLLLSQQWRSSNHLFANSDPYNACVDLLRECSSSRALLAGKRVHHFILQREQWSGDRLLGNLVVQMYGACGCVTEARAVFDAVRGRNVFSWNLLLAAYAQNGYMIQGKESFDRMPSTDVISWSTLISSCCQSGELVNAKIIFDLMPQREVISWNSLFAAYTHHGEPRTAMLAFSLMPAHSVASWNSMIRFSADSGEVDTAVQVFRSMPQRDEVSWNSMLCAYTQAGHMELALSFFNLFPRRNSRAWNAMISGYDESRAEMSISMFHSCPERNSVSWNGLISANASNFLAQRAVFDAMPQHDVVSWTSMIQACLEQGLDEAATTLFDEMPGKNVVTWTMVVTAHGDHNRFAQALESFHRMPLHNLVTWNAMLGVFARIGRAQEAATMFESLPIKDTVSWNTMISAYASSGYFQEAKEVFLAMPNKDVVSWNSIIFAATQRGDFHSAKRGFDAMPDRDVVSWNTLIQAFVNEGWMADAMALLHSGMDALHSSAETWSILIRGYSANASAWEALEIFNKMDVDGVEPASVTYVAILDACSAPEFLEHGKHIHARARYYGLDRDFSVASSLITMYARCGSLDQAVETYNYGPRDEVCSNAMVRGYAHAGRMEDARHLLKGIRHPSVESWNSLLKGLARNGQLQEAKSLFLHEIPVRDSTSWSTMVCALVEAGHGGEALAVFRGMDLEGWKPDSRTVVAALEACGSQLGDLTQCRILHSSIVEGGVDCARTVETSIVSMYAKCGSLASARELFERSQFRGRACWSAMIAGYAQNGHAREALHLFQRMLLEGVEPSGITLVSVISACGHTGALADGLHCFASLDFDFGVAASADIYKCVVDVLGRAGMLSEAEEFIRGMPAVAADGETWQSLLGSCHSHGDVRRGKRIVARKEVLSCSTTFVLLSNIFAQS